MKKFSILVVLFFLTNFVSAQINGDGVKVIYSYHVPNNGKMSDETYSYLTANNKTSFFVTQRNDFPKPENQVTQGANSIALKVFDADDIGSFVYRDFTKDSIVFREVGSKFMKPVLVTDLWEKMLWKISSETKKVGEYDCLQATCKFRGRDYTAWFTEAIPISSGPWKLFGLPGLILEAYDSDKHFYVIAKELLIKYPVSPEKEDYHDNSENVYDYEEYKTYRKNYKDIYISAIKAKMPRGANLNLKHGDIKISPIETEFK